MTPALSILPFSPAVAMLDVVTWLARRLGQRCCAGPQPPGVQKQLKALQDLAGGLALLAPHQTDETFLAKAIPQVNALMTTAARCERRGVRHAELAEGLPGPLPGGRLRLCLPDLCLTYVMGWRAALEIICAHGGPPHRVRQLKLAIALEEGLRLISRVAPAHTAQSRQAAQEANKLFDELGAP